MRLSGIGVSRVSLRIAALTLRTGLTLMAAVLVGTSCSPGVAEHADGDGPLEFAPGSETRLELPTTATEILWGAFVLNNTENVPMRISRIDVVARGDCAPSTVGYLEPRGPTTGTATGPPESVGAVPLFAADNTVVPATGAAAILFAIDGSACGEGSVGAYGPIAVDYESVEPAAGRYATSGKQYRGTYDYYLTVAWGVAVP